MRSLRGSTRQHHKSTSTLIRSTGHRLTKFSTSTSNRHNVFQQVISNILRRILRHDFSNLVIDSRRRIRILFNFLNRFLNIHVRRRLPTIRKRSRTSILQFNLSLIFNRHLTYRKRRKRPFHIRRHYHTLHFLRISRAISRFHRSFKFLKSSTKRMFRHIQVINHITSHFNRREGHTYQNFRFIQSINSRVTPRSFRATLLTRIKGRGHG